MKEKLTLTSGSSNDNTTIAKGLAPIVCYDPWFPRSLESIKQSIYDGHPVLIRLHSAASYPVHERYQIDLESHAVLIVGYDDEKQAVLLLDPWDRSWGGNFGGKRWLPYKTLEILNVNTSLGMTMNLSPLEVNSKLQFDKVNNLSLDLQLGFYVPRGTIMDRQSWIIRKISVQCELPKYWESSDVKYEMAGTWLVGDTINMSLPIMNNPLNDGEINLNIQATIEGSRPYNFVDNISIQEKLQVTIPKVELQIEKINKIA